MSDIEPSELRGEQACWLHRVCARCGALAEEEHPAVCRQCGAAEFGE